METSTLTFENLRKVLEEYGQHAETLYKYNIALAGKNASRTLANNTKYFVKSEGVTFSVGLRLEEYWKYVEYGRKPGKFPPPSAILKWIEVKPVIPRPDDKGRIPKPKTLAFLIGRKIATEGIKPTPVLQTTVEELNNTFLERIREALKQDIGDALAIISTKQF
ncbi:MAG: hypothetical protein II236_03265 [Alistipes sp.]|nr:hypothetical protein [Alistipes sp.]MBQ5903706.1 hypothetical protein [Alistipes sp.]